MCQQATRGSLPPKKRATNGYPGGLLMVFNLGIDQPPSRVVSTNCLARTMWHQFPVFWHILVNSNTIKTIPNLACITKRMQRSSLLALYQPASREHHFITSPDGHFTQMTASFPKRAVDLGFFPVLSGPAFQGWNRAEMAATNGCRRPIMRLRSSSIAADGA